MIGNGQSAAKPLSNEERSTTIPEGSTGSNPGKKPVYLKVRNVIYKITCKSNNKFYIGSASYYDKRIGTHIALLRRNKHANPYLQNAFNKYGEDSFVFDIIEYVESQELLIEREQFWIDKTKCYDRHVGFNQLKIAGTTKGHFMPESAKQKIREYQTGKKDSAETLNKKIEYWTKLTGKPVICFDKDMNLIGEFVSISDASRKTGYNVSTISVHCSKLQKGRNLTFRYKDIV